MLVIAIDGLRPDALEAADAPNIHTLIRDGCYSDEAQCEDLTFSGPNHSSILHGVHRDKHNVTSNDYKDNRLADWPDFFTYVEWFDSNLNTFRFHTWKEAHTHQPTGADVAILCDYEKDGDEEMTRQVVALLGGMHPQYLQDPDIIFLFYSDVDEAGHAHGFHPCVPGYLAEIADTDSKVGRVLSAVRQRPSFGEEDWLMVLTSDHGGSADKGHSGGTPERRTIPFLVYGPDVLRGRPFPPPKNVDVAITVLRHMGIGVRPEWNLDGHCVGICSCETAVSSNSLCGMGMQGMSQQDRHSLAGMAGNYCAGCPFHEDPSSRRWMRSGPDVTASLCCKPSSCPCLFMRRLGYGENLIFNGDAEYDRGFPSTAYDQAISGWEDFGPNSMTVVAYGSPDGYPTAQDPGPPDRGANFFAGGSGAEARIVQTIDVRPFSKDIDRGRVGSRLSGWLGGYADQGDHAELSAAFLDAGGLPLGRVALAPVRADDRGKKTGLSSRETSAPVPRGTTHIRVELRCARAGDGSNDGYADNLALVLSRK